jgi:hypothetical protein
MDMTEITALTEPRMLLRSLAAASLCTALLLNVATPSEAATLIDENFDTSVPTFNITTSGTIPSFTVTDGSVDIIGTTGGQFEFYPGNGAYVDLNGNDPGTIESSTFGFAAGEIVNVSFSYGANGENRTGEVFFGTASLGTFTASQSTGVFQTFSTSFTVATAQNASLIFKGLNAGASGVVLDNVSLTTGAAVPEPATLPALLTLGAIGGALVVRRKQISEQV